MFSVNVCNCLGMCCGRTYDSNICSLSCATEVQFDIMFPLLNSPWICMICLSVSLKWSWSMVCLHCVHVILLWCEWVVSGWWWNVWQVCHNPLDVDKLVIWLSWGSCWGMAVVLWVIILWEFAFHFLALVFGWSVAMMVVLMMLVSMIPPVWCILGGLQIWMLLRLLSTLFVHVIVMSL